jgi:putative Mg2+ transporter-C (MgtC) family protein
MGRKKMLQDLDGGLAVEETFRLVIALLLGGIIGWQREHYGHEAGVRTFSLISLGSCLFGILSHHMAFPGDPGRIAAQVVSGIGFIGVGLIIKEQGSIKGLTTAATLWAVSAVGLSMGYGLYYVAVLTCTLIFISLFLRSIPHWDKIIGKPSQPRKERMVSQETSEQTPPTTPEK